MPEESQVALTGSVSQAGRRGGSTRSVWKSVPARIDLAGEIAKVRAWASKGLLAIVDQGLISSSNFVLSVTLARWGGPHAYGTYMAVFATFLLIANLYQALLLEPSNVLAFSLFPERNSRYVRVLLRMHLIFCCGFLVLGGAALVVASQMGVDAMLINAVGGVVVATPFVLLFWLARCFAYLEFSPGTAAAGSLAYCVVLGACLLYARAEGGVTPFRAFLCTAAAGSAASVLLLFRYRRRPLADPRDPSMRHVWRRHWNYGRWGLATFLMSWAQTNGVSVMSGRFLGLSGVGGLNALFGLLLPMVQVLAAIARVAVTRIAQIFTHHGQEAIVKPVIRVAVAFLGLASGYAIVLALFHTPILHFIYGDRFVQYAGMAPIISLHLVGSAGIMACDIGFVGIRRPQAAVPIKVFMMIVTTAVTMVLSWRFGLTGATVAIPLCSTVTAILMAIRLVRVWRRHDVSPAT